MRDLLDILKDMNIDIKEEENDEIQLVIDIVNNMANRREDLEMSQRELSRKSGISQATIARIEQQGNIPKINTLLKLLRPLNLTLKVVKLN